MHQYPSLPRYFDAPVESADHAILRDTAWMAGPQIEAIYLLSRLMNRNLFRDEPSQFLDVLKTYLESIMSPKSASVLAQDTTLAVCWLRFEANKFKDIKQIQKKSLGQAIYALALDPSLPDESLARVSATTTYQIQQFPEIRIFRNRYHS